MLGLLTLNQAVVETVSYLGPETLSLVRVYACVNNSFQHNAVTLGCSVNVLLLLVLLWSGRQGS